MQNSKKWSPAIMQPENSDITTWVLPEGAIARLGQGDMMADSTPQPIAPSPDGKYLVIGNRIGVWWYDLSTMTPVALWDTGRGWITAVAFSPNGKWLVTGDGEAVVKVWDAQRGICISEMERDETKNDSVSHLVFSPDSRHLASSCEWDYILYVWHAETGEQIAKFHSETDFRWSGVSTRPIAFSSDGILLACTMPDDSLLTCADTSGRIRTPEHSFNYIAVWNMKTGARVACLTEPTDFAESLCFSPCGQFLASGGQKGSVRVWAVATWEMNRAFHTYGTTPKKVFYSPEGILYAAEVSDDTFAVWDVECEKKSNIYLQTHHGLQGSHLPKECPFVSVNEREFTVRNVGNSQPKTFSYSYIGVPNSVVFSSDGKTLAGGCWGEGVMLWDVANLSEPLSRFNPPGGDFTVSISPGKFYAAGTGPGPSFNSFNAARVWEVGNDKMPIATVPLPEQENRVAVGISVFAPISNLIACGDNEGTLYVMDVEQQNVRHTLKAHTGWIRLITFSPNEKHLVSIRYAGPESRLWNVESGEAIETFPNKTTHIAFSPCSTIVACCGEREILLWDIGSREMIKTVPQPKDSWGTPFALAFSPCGRYLASGSWWQQGVEKMAIRLWDVENGEDIATFSGHSSDIQDLAFSPDGTMLATGSYDKTILLWDLKPYIGA